MSNKASCVRHEGRNLPGRVCDAGSDKPHQQIGQKSAYRACCSDDLAGAEEKTGTLIMLAISSVWDRSRSPYDHARNGNHVDVTRAQVTLELLRVNSNALAVCAHLHVFG